MHMRRLTAAAIDTQTLMHYINLLIYICMHAAAGHGLSIILCFMKEHAYNIAPIIYVSPDAGPDTRDIIMHNMSLNETEISSLAYY